MVLEPIAPPRVGQVLNLIGGILAAGSMLLSATITSANDFVGIAFIAGPLAVGFFVRFAGTTYGIRKGQWGMPWGARIGSWVPFGLAALLLGLAGAVISAATFGAFVVIDAIGGFVKREMKVPEVKPRSKRAFPWMALAILLYLAFVVAFHLFIGQYLPFGILLTWSLLAFGFSAFLLVQLRGVKGSEAHLTPPFDHRRHERREERVIDPQRQRAERVLAAFSGRGDAGPFLDLVREAARSADLKMEDVHALESRILSSFGRAGTDREQDIRMALDEVERLLALRSRST